jgi:hypothetical protein
LTLRRTFYKEFGRLSGSFVKWEKLKKNRKQVSKGKRWNFKEKVLILSFLGWDI